LSNFLLQSDTDLQAQNCGGGGENHSLLWALIPLLMGMIPDY